MMHDKNTGFVIAILNQDKVLREINGTVHLPFNSEYTIRVKNPTDERVGVSIDVDGTSISQHKIIVNAGSSIDVKRMLIDGDMHNGPALRFVPISHNDVQDPTSSENGLITVRFYKERASTAKQFFDEYLCKASNSNVRSATKGTSGDAGWMASMPTTSSSSRGIGGQSVGSASMNNISKYDANVLSDTYGAASGITGAAGATIPGANVSQRFKNVSIDLYDNPCAELTLRMVGFTAPVYTQSKKIKNRCSNELCKAVLHTYASYCHKCGTQVIHI